MTTPGVANSSTAPAGAASADSSAFAVAELGPQLDGVLAVEQVRGEGHAVAFGGHLLLPPSPATTKLVARFRPFGYTPFLQAGQGLTWVRALPFVDVEVPSRPRTNIILFLLTVLSTLVAGSGAFFAFDPLAEPRRLLEGIPFSFTLLAILGTHEFGHYFTARAYGASVSLPYFIPAPPPLLFGTLGAIIRMRSPARDRNSLFDIAAAGPLALLGLVWLMFGRTRRKEAENFTRSVIAMRTEARALEDVLAALSRQIDHNHEALGQMAGSLMGLGDETATRIASVTADLGRSSGELVAQSALFDRATDQVRRDLGVMMADLPLAEEQALNMAGALRAAGEHSSAQAAAFFTAVQALNDCTAQADATIDGATSRLVGHLSNVESAAAAAASTSTASTRWPSALRPAGVGTVSTTRPPTSGINQWKPDGGRRTRRGYYR